MEVKDPNKAKEVDKGKQKLNVSHANCNPKNPRHAIKVLNSGKVVGNVDDVYKWQTHKGRKNGNGNKQLDLPTNNNATIVPATVNPSTVNPNPNFANQFVALGEGDGINTDVVDVEGVKKGVVVENVKVGKELVAATVEIFEKAADFVEEFSLDASLKSSAIVVENSNGDNVQRIEESKVDTIEDNGTKVLENGTNMHNMDNTASGEQEAIQEVNINQVDKVQNGQIHVIPNNSVQKLKHKNTFDASILWPKSSVKKNVLAKNGASGSKEVTQKNQKVKDTKQVVQHEVISSKKKHNQNQEK
ncbi:hypothetical protein RND71_019228 [Anisodus tanguticus]|uniref:Uncharacterized protein n=1 Tax=Anisodus tanguticus TaxID=243964 RepID=A0AAE1S0I7_9SOLA|nr:hypothetical protein RND71_019228 [Anisodus tanguticus]